MPIINKNEFRNLHLKTPNRRIFSEHPILNRSKKWVSIPFRETMKDIFEHDLQIKLFLSKKYSNYWRHSLTPEEIDQIEKWQNKYKEIVFLRSLLDTCIALSLNFDKEPGDYTKIGELEHEAKINEDQKSIIELEEILFNYIISYHPYKDADYICAVPCKESKNFDLPNHLVECLSSKIGKRDITKSCFSLKEKDELKSGDWEEKWKGWENSDLGVSSQNNNVSGKTIILLDDKYQSGVTMHYIAMKLYELGIKKIYGLNVVKTWSDDKLNKV